jgi:hypothetical protein
MRRARRLEVRLTEEVRDDEAERRLAAATPASFESYRDDEGGEGGSKMENGGGLGGSHRGGKNGDGGGRKHTSEGRGGSVVGVDGRRVAWLCMEESEGGKRRGKRDGVGQLFEAEAAR